MCKEKIRATASKLARKPGLKTGEATDHLTAAGFLELRDGKPFLTAKGKATGFEFRIGQYGPFFLWPGASPAVVALAQLIS